MYPTILGYNRRLSQPALLSVSGLPGLHTQFLLSAPQHTRAHTHTHTHTPFPLLFKLIHTHLCHHPVPSAWEARETSGTGTGHVHQRFGNWARKGQKPDWMQLSSASHLSPSTSESKWGGYLFHTFFGLSTHTLCHAHTHTHTHTLHPVFTSHCFVM